MKRYLALIVAALALVSVVMGGIFIKLAADNTAWMQQAAAQEKVTLGLTEEQIRNGEVIDTAQEMQTAADILREHRRSIAPTYNDLLAGGRYDPTNPTHLMYSQAINMENYLYLGVLGFGVTQMITVVGVFMIVIGIALGAVGLFLFSLTRKAPLLGEARTPALVNA